MTEQRIGREVQRMIERKFEYFLTIAELGNITKAAEKNYISQPSMTQYLNRLEQSVGMKLFDRTVTPIALTRAGEIFYNYVVKCMELDNQLEEDLHALKVSVSGTVILGIPLQMQVLLVRNMLPKFIDKYPNVDISIRDDASPALEKAVQNDRVDCALIFNQKFNYEKLDYHKLKDERIFAVCGKTHPIVAGRASSKDNPIPVSLQDIGDDIFYLMERGFIVRAISDAFFKQHSFVPKKKISMASMTALMDAVYSSSGVTFIPEYVIDTFENKDQLAYLEIEGEQFWMELSLVAKKEKNLSPATKTFIDFTKEFYGKEADTIV